MHVSFLTTVPNQVRAFAAVGVEQRGRSLLLSFGGSNGSNHPEWSNDKVREAKLNLALAELVFLSGLCSAVGLPLIAGLSRR